MSWFSRNLLPDRLEQHGIKGNIFHGKPSPAPSPSPSIDHAAIEATRQLEATKKAAEAAEKKAAAEKAAAEKAAVEKAAAEKAAEDKEAADARCKPVEEVKQKAAAYFAEDKDDDSAFKSEQPLEQEHENPVLIPDIIEQPTLGG